MEYGRRFSDAKTPKEMRISGDLCGCSDACGKEEWGTTFGELHKGTFGMGGRRRGIPAARLQAYQGRKSGTTASGCEMRAKLKDELSAGA